MEGEAKLQQDSEQFKELKKQADDLNFLAAEKSKSNQEYKDELANAKRVLAEQEFEVGKKKSQLEKMGDETVDLEQEIEEIKRDIEAVQKHRADMYREINRLRDLQGMRDKEALDQKDYMKQQEMLRNNAH